MGSEGWDGEHWEAQDPALMRLNKVNIFPTLLGISIVENTEGVWATHYVPGKTQWTMGTS